MGIKVYRQGNTHNVNGIECEIRVIPPELFSGQPEKGWRLRLGDINGLQREEEENKEEGHQEINIDDRPKRTRKKRNNKPIQGV